MAIISTLLESCIIEYTFVNPNESLAGIISVCLYLKLSMRCKVGISGVRQPNCEAADFPEACLALCWSAGMSPFPQASLHGYSAARPAEVCDTPPPTLKQHSEPNQGHFTDEKGAWGLAPCHQTINDRMGSKSKP